MNIIDKIADCIIEESKKREIDDLTPMKMEKLLYYIWVWYGVLYKKSIFNEEPQAWLHGPVFPSIYKRFAPKGKSIILDSDITHGCESIKEIDFINGVLDKYIYKSASELRKESHNSLWENAFNNMDKSIKLNRTIDYYSKNLKEAVNIIYDEEEDVWVATSNILPGLVLESDNYKQLLSEIEENGRILVEENCN